MQYAELRHDNADIKQKNWTYIRRRGARRGVTACSSAVGLSQPRARVTTGFKRSSITTRLRPDPADTLSGMALACITLRAPSPGTIRWRALALTRFGLGGSTFASVTHNNLKGFVLDTT